MKYSKLLFSFLAVSVFTAGYASTPCTLEKMCYLTEGVVTYFDYYKPGNYVCALSVPSSSTSQATADLHMGSAAKFKPMVVTSGTPVQLYAGIDSSKGTKGELKFELQKGQDYAAGEVGVKCVTLPSSSN